MIINQHHRQPQYREDVLEFYRKYDADVGVNSLRNRKLMNNDIVLLNRLDNIADFNKDVDVVYQKLGDIQKSNLCSGLTEYDYELLNVDRNVNWIRTTAESINRFQSTLLLPSDIKDNGNVDLYNIAERLGYKNEYKKLKDQFFMNIRNALSHSDYRYIFNEHKKFDFLIYYNDDKEYRLTMRDIRTTIEKMIELSSIHKSLIDYYKKR